MKHRAALLSLTLVLGSCSGAGGPPGTDGRSTPASLQPPGLTMVTISDSAFGAWLTGKAVDVGVADAYGKWIERDLGQSVAISPFVFGGSSSRFVLDRIRTDESLRTALRTADVILFDVPMGELKELCPWDGRYFPAPGTAAEYQACGQKMAASYGEDATAIVKEIVALRSPAEAIIRTTELWDLFHRRFEAMGLGTVVRETYRAVNAALGRAAAAHGIPVAPAHLAFMGPDGTRDPIAAGDVQADELHLTDQGVTKLAGLLRDLGYLKASPPPAR